jgi:hypothetical protein
MLYQLSYSRITSPVHLSARSVREPHFARLAGTALARKPARATGEI